MITIAVLISRVSFFKSFSSLVLFFHFWMIGILLLLLTVLTFTLISSTSYSLILAHFSDHCLAGIIYGSLFLAGDFWRFGISLLGTIILPSSST